MGSKRRNEYIKSRSMQLTDFLPERPYSLNGIQAIPRKHTDDFFLLFMPREAEIKSQLNMEDDETFVDVGANVGYYSLFVGNKYRDKHVKIVAIEAHPDNFRALTRNIQINKIDSTLLINKAVSDTKGKEVLYEHVIMYGGDRDENNRIQTGHASICRVFDSSSSFEVESDKLDNMLDKYSPSVMKIDIEGAEVRALRGADKILKRLRKIIVEIHGQNLDDVCRILHQYDFKICNITGSDGMLYVIGTSRRDEGTSILQ